MIFKNLVFLGLLASSATARLSSPDEVADTFDDHLDLEVVVEGGERQLFPLLPGTKCPAGHRCRTRSGTARTGEAPMMSSLKNNLNTQLAATLDWHEMNKNLNAVVMSDDYCSRRAAMTRAAGLAAGVAAVTVSQPAYAAQTVSVKMGTDSGLLAFEPKKVTICAGDTVKWTNNKAGPHNVVFDEDDIPDGVDQEKISMDEQLGEEGDTWSMKFDTAGNYGYYCEPHRGAGMTAQLVVA